MCGLAGVISYNKNLDASIINQVADLISYRGPDDEGALSLNTDINKIKTFKRASELNDDSRSGRIFFGHRRLSIIDLTQDGHQPMSYMNGRYWIIYNGEIYNYIELKKELISLGYNFKSQTDTEVILAAYDNWGEDCLNYFNGMWSFILLDLKKQTIWGTTDRYGIKPMYFYDDGNYICFSSEVKQILSLDFLNKALDTGSIFDFLFLGSNTDSYETTMFKNVKRLKGGQSFSLSYDQSKISKLVVSEWYNLSSRLYKVGGSEDKIISKFSSLLNDSVNLRLRSDVPIGAALSGGLDSSGIVKIIDKLNSLSGIDTPLLSFSAGSNDESLNELNYVDELLKSVDSRNHKTIPTGTSFFDDLEKLIFHLDYPYQSTSCYASWKVYSLAQKNNVTVVFDGQGADEILGGYYTYMYPSLFIDNVINYNFSELYKNMLGMKKLYGFSYSKQMSSFMKRSIMNSNKFSTFYKKQFKNRFLSKDFLEQGQYRSHVMRDLIDTESLENSFSNHQIHYMNGLLSSLLRIVDRNSMAHSVESRVPFLDYRLVELCISLPTKMKIRGGLTKWIYRSAMKGLLPKKINNRINKLGFATAQDSWLNNNRGHIREIFYSNKDFLLPIVGEDGLEKLYYPDKNNISNHLLWKLLSTTIMANNFKLKL